MQIELREILYQAHEQYLQGSEIELLRSHLGSLKERLDTYRIIRDGELTLWQGIADQLLGELNSEAKTALPDAIVHWASVLRYGSMAMILNNPQFLNHRLLEWLTPVIQAHQRLPVENRVYELMRSRLKGMLSAEQWNLIYPFLEQAQVAVLT